MRLTREQIEYQLREYWLTRAEAARMIGVSGEYVHALASAGRIETVDVAAKVRLYSRQDVQRIAQERKGDGA